MKKSVLFLSLLTLVFTSCAGEDYDPVYFPGAQSEGAENPSGADLELSKAQCHLELTARLCVKIKGDNIEVGTTEEDPLCADTPPIPLEIEGEKIILKGSDFPDIHVSVEVRGVDTPMTINGKGETDGSQNFGEGSWTPDGHITIKNFSFYINVLGMSGEIPNLDLTTDEARSVPDLPAVEGKPVSEAGETRLVTATVLGSLFRAADEFLLGASMQAIFEGTINPPLSECAEEIGSKKEIRVVKLRPAAGGTFMEEAIPDGNILEISKGTYIARDERDVGSLFETTVRFKVTNEGEKPVEMEIPAAVGPFLLFTEGTSKKTLAPNKGFEFEVTFKPTTTNTPAPGTIKENLSLGGSRFFLMGVALEPQGNVAVSQINDSGETLAPHIQTLNMDTLYVPAIQTRADPDETPSLQLNLSGGSGTSLRPSKKLVTLANQGVMDLEITNIAIEEFPDSQSQGQFQFLSRSLLKGPSLAEASAATLPVTLPVVSNPPLSLFVSVTYLPTDLIGWDGQPPQAGQAALDKAYLVISTSAGTQKILLTGKTKIEELPPLQVFFATATGIKSKTGLETFTFEEVTPTTKNLAYPVFLNVSETAPSGVRITEIKIQGEDAGVFEWLDSQEEVDARIPAAGEGKRCSIPVFDPNTGGLLEERFDLDFVTMGSQGVDLKPGLFTQANLPLFGCVNFHPAEGATKKIFEADLIVSGLQLDSQGSLLRNADNSTLSLSLTVRLVAAINPIRGHMVLRIPQTVAAILNPQAVTLTAVATKKEIDLMVRDGRGSREEEAVLLGALILDPFDEMSVTDSQREVVSNPGDGVTGVFRGIDTRPSTTNYSEPTLFDFTSLLHDSGLSQHPGIFHDYDFPETPLPDPLKVNGWRIFTGALSYPGPLSPRSPISRAECDTIDPCSPEGLRQFTESGIGSDGRGACAFFFASGGSYHSPAFEPVIQGERDDLCAHRGEPRQVLAMDTGHYSVDGSITFEDVGLRFWGPTYFNNPHGPLGPTAALPLDEVFHAAFTTELLKPASGPDDFNVLPDEKIDFGREEYKINLTEPDWATPPICPKNTGNRRLGGRAYSSWRYVAPLIFKDEAGEIPAGCPEEGTSFTGGTAYLKGRRLDPETKIFTLVMGAKFGNREELTPAFKDIMIFVALNGWVCDPQGNEENFEGTRCFDSEVNERDQKAQISIVEE